MGPVTSRTIQFSRTEGGSRLRSFRLSSSASSVSNLRSGIRCLTSSHLSVGGASILANHSPTVKSFFSLRVGGAGSPLRSLGAGPPERGGPFIGAAGACQPSFFSLRRPVLRPGSPLALRRARLSACRALGRVNLLSSSPRSTYFFRPSVFGLFSLGRGRRSVVIPESGFPRRGGGTYSGAETDQHKKRRGAFRSGFSLPNRSPPPSLAITRAARPTTTSPSAREAASSRRRS